jgi:hypothetical protein
LQFRGCYGGVSMSAGETSDSTVIDSRYNPARQRDSFGGSTSGLTRFSAAPAAFLLDAMAAEPRKWVSDGAPTLPSCTSALPRECCGGVSMNTRGLRFGSHRQPLQNRAKEGRLCSPPKVQKQAAFCYEGLEMVSTHFLLCASRDSTKFGMTG